MLAITDVFVFVYLITKWGLCNLTITLAVIILSGFHWKNEKVTVPSFLDRTVIIIQISIKSYTTGNYGLLPIP